MERKTIVSVGAHHDDVELRSGGTLARYGRENWRVIYAVATTTPHYHPLPEQISGGEYLSNNEVIQLRKEEASRGAEILGADEVHFFDFKSLYWYRERTMERVYPDGISVTSADLKYLETEIPGREFIVTANRCGAALDFLCGFLAEKKADIVLTHTPDDSHWEHYATSAFVGQAVRRLSREGRDIKLYGWEPGGASMLFNSFAPTRFVDISDTIEIKCRALEVFKSQFPGHDAGKFALRARKRARDFGKIAGMEFAEPFMDFNLEARDSDMEVLLPRTYDGTMALKGL